MFLFVAVMSVFILKYIGNLYFQVEMDIQGILLLLPRNSLYLYIINILIIHHTRNNADEDISKTFSLRDYSPC